MGKNNQKKEKALRNLENARKYKKRPPSRFGGPRRGPGGAAGPASGPAGAAAGRPAMAQAAAVDAPVEEDTED